MDTIRTFLFVLRFTESLRHSNKAMKWMVKRLLLLIIDGTLCNKFCSTTFSCQHIVTDRFHLSIILWQMERIILAVDEKFRFQTIVYRFMEIATILNFKCKYGSYGTNLYIFVHKWNWLNINGFDFIWFLIPTIGNQKSLKEKNVWLSIKFKWILTKQKKCYPEFLEEHFDCEKIRFYTILE